MDFLKITGSGNDFVVIDNRKNAVKKRKQAAVALCGRKFGVGADGLLLLENSKKADFRMRVFNPDGSEAEMCGNGLRCILRFAAECGIVRKNAMRVETGAGVLEGAVKGRTVKAQLSVGGKPVTGLTIPLESGEITGHFINTGVPHTVIVTDELNGIRVNELGPFIRNHRMFHPKGTNVDWIEVKGKHSIGIRTYERGVEGETLSCGTGSAAGAIISFLLGKTVPPVKVTARSGEILTVYFDSSLSKIHLEGNIFISFKGEWLGK
ncbi:MAG: diaminopimelate epimerase [Candidatus Omnitrophica bacterium]|nr:diaminopimelate epimerase [Candidatus Omnitrophota bacterium]